jgi:hypothetical protein
MGKLSIRTGNSYRMKKANNILRKMEEAINFSATFEKYSLQSCSQIYCTSGSCLQRFY